MMQKLSKMGINQRLALVALLLGAGALLSRPVRGSSVVVAPRELAIMVQRGADRVAAREVADRIIKGTGDYRLVDLRDESAFAAYHLPGAENLPIASLTDAGLLRNEMIIVYADDGAEAAQAWFLLQANGFTGARVLAGGLDAWKHDVLYPVLKENPTPAEQAENARLAQVASHFGGAAATRGAATAAPPATGLPRIDAPSLPASGKPAAARKKKEGC